MDSLFFRATPASSQEYQWMQQDVPSAEAHEGEKVRSRLFTFWLRLGLTVDDGQLKLSTLSSRLGFVGTTDSPVAMRIRSRLRRCARAIDTALTEAGLAA